MAAPTANNATKHRLQHIKIRGAWASCCERVPGATSCVTQRFACFRAKILGILPESGHRCPIGQIDQK